MKGKANNTRHLTKALLKATDNGKLELLIKQLMSENEIKEITSRLEIAKRLLKWQSYKTIEGQIWVSSTTIAKVSQVLKQHSSILAEVAKH